MRVGMVFPIFMGIPERFELALVDQLMRMRACTELDSTPSRGTSVEVSAKELITTCVQVSTRYIQSSMSTKASRVPTCYHKSDGETI